MREEAGPEVRIGRPVPRPVRGLEVLEDDPRFLVAIRRIAPYVEIALHAAGGRAPRALEPRVLVGGVVEDELRDDADVAALGLLDDDLQVGDGAHVRVNVHVVGDVVAVVFAGRRTQGQQPDGRDAEVFDVVELGGEPCEIADAVPVRVVERARAELVDDRVLVPERIVVLDPGRPGSVGAGWWRGLGLSRSRRSVERADRHGRQPWSGWDDLVNRKSQLNRRSP